MKRINVMFTYIYFHFSVESIVEQEIVSHPDAVGLHWMPLAIVVITDVSCNHIKSQSFI